MPYKKPAEKHCDTEKVNRGQVKEIVKRAISTRVEDKFISRSSGPSFVQTSGLFQLLNGMVRGANVGEHVGDQVRMKYLKLGIRVAVTATQSALTPSNSVRVILFYDKQANKLTPAVADFLLSNFTISPIDATLTPSRFKILYDKDHQIVSPYNTGSMTKDIRINKNLKDMKVWFDEVSNAGTVADITKGSLYSLVVTNIATNNIDVVHDWLLTYEDA